MSAVLTVLRNPHVLDAPLTDLYSQEMLSQVQHAGCDVEPAWANGALMMAPLTELQVKEAVIQLAAHHIVVSQQNQASGVIGPIGPPRKLYHFLIGACTSDPVSFFIVRPLPACQ